MVNKFFVIVKQLRYLETSVINQNCFHGEIKSRANSGNVNYRPFQKFSSFHLLANILKIRILRTVILHAAFVLVRNLISDITGRGA
jgi:hypothetical protein